jgi:hypothetical protein
MSVANGTTDIRTFIVGWKIPSKGTKGLLSNVFVANFVSSSLLCHILSYNSTITSLMLAKEANNYADFRKGLRVNARALGSQRSTYFPSIPYNFAIPLLTVATMMHWLCSTSIFLFTLEVDQLKDVVAGIGQTYQYLICAYSLQGMLYLIVMCFIMLTGLVILARRTLPCAIPISGSCSASISAMCHSTAGEDSEAVLKPVKWGVTSKEEDSDKADNDFVGHCSFSSGSIEPPKNGVLYAGEKELDLR